MSDSQPNLDHISPDLRSLAVPIEALKKMIDNPRNHDDRSIKLISVSLKTFGQQKPVVVSADGEVIAGNGTLEAAEELGWTHVAASKSELTGDEAKAYAIADNKTTDESTFNFDIVKSVFSDLDDLLKEATGFTDDEIEAALAIDDEEDEDEDGARDIGGEDPEAMGDTEFRVVVLCTNAQDQAALMGRLEAEGYQCQPLMS